MINIDQDLLKMNMFNISPYMLILILIFIGGTMTIIINQNSIAQESKNLNPVNGSGIEQRYVIQKSEMSKPASATVTPHGKIPHQIVFGLPIRDDGKIWTGTVTFTASKPIEVEVLHKYAPQTIPDKEHGEPYHATLPGNNTVAISTMQMFSETPVIFTNSPISTGSFVFTGNAVVFHNTSGEPFSVTYTIDAVSRMLTTNQE